MIKKLSLILTNSTDTNFSPNLFNDYVELKMKVNIVEIFLIFGVFFFYSDFFDEVEKAFTNIPSPSVSVKELRKLKGIKNEFLVEILLLCSNSFMEDYNLNTVSTIEDAEEILEKGSSTKIPFSTFCDKFVKNYDIITDLFSIDDKAYEYQNVLNNLNYLNE